MVELLLVSCMGIYVAGDITEEFILSLNYLT